MRERIETLISDYSNKGVFSGNILVKEKGESVVKLSKGLANRDWSIKNNITTKFRVASLSKMFTAVAILTLIDQKKITLETQVKAILGDIESTIPEKLTVFQLLTHTSGLRDYYDESTGYEGWDVFVDNNTLHKLVTNKDFADLFINLEPENEPGTKYKYNNGGYILLAMVIEKIEGQSFESYVKQEVFEPLGMIDTFYGRLDHVQKNTAEGYTKQYNQADEMIGWMKNIYEAIPASAGDGGATTTVDDLFRFYDGIRSGALLSETSREHFFSAHVVDELEGYLGYDWKYGFAQMIIEKDEEIIRMGHTGEEAGVSCRYYYYPKIQVDVIILGNQDGAAGKLGWDIHHIIMDKYYI